MLQANSPDTFYICAPPNTAMLQATFACHTSFLFVADIHFPVVVGEEPDPSRYGKEEKTLGFLCPTRFNS